MKESRLQTFSSSKQNLFLFCSLFIFYLLVFNRHAKETRLKKIMAWRDQEINENEGREQPPGGTCFFPFDPIAWSTDDEKEMAIGSGKNMPPADDRPLPSLS